MNRDLVAAGIEKKDADGCVVHVHALRHSFGTHLSRAGVAPRVASLYHTNSDICMQLVACRRQGRAGLLETGGERWLSRKPRWYRGGSLFLARRCRR
jgi:hypothetical protein